MSKCNRDCFNCPFPDCIEDYASREEIEDTRVRDAEFLLLSKDNKERRIAEKAKAYYEANREQIAEKAKAYREANRGAYNEYMREYMREYRLGMRKKEGGKKRLTKNVYLAAEERHEVRA